MASATKDSLTVYDPSVDAKIKYQMRTMTRAAKRELREALQELVEFQAGLPDNQLEVSGDQEDKATRLMCDIVNLGTTTPEDKTPAGDLLYDGWIDERVVDEEIIAAFEQVTGQDASPPT